jgi:hypothetical protein
LCYLADVRPKDARDLVRALRLSFARKGSDRVADLLELSDRRTLNRFLKRAGLEEALEIPAPIALLELQRFISSSHSVLRELCTLVHAFESAHGQNLQDKSQDVFQQYFQHNM